MLCADFKVRLRLWPTSYAEAEWVNILPNDYAAYLDFYKLAATQDQGGMAKARAGWIILGEERIWAQAFQPTMNVDEKTNTKGTAKGTLVHLHGYYDHGACYPALQRWALKNKLYYVTADLPGHGLSSGERASIKNFADYQKLLTSLVKLLETEKMPRPWLLSGFSTGASIAIEHQLTEKRFDSTLLLAPLIRPVAWKGALVKWLWLPQLLVKKLPRKFMNNSSDAEFLRFAQQQDCLQGKQLPLAWIAALGRWIRLIENTQSSDIEVLIIQGDADSTVDWQYNLPVLNRLFPKATVKMVKSGGHQLLNEGELERTQVFNCLDEWLDSINKESVL